MTFILDIADGNFGQAVAQPHSNSDFVNTYFIIYSHKNTLFMNYASRMLGNGKLANDLSK